MAVPSSSLSAVQVATKVKSHATPRHAEIGPGNVAVAVAARRSLKRFYDKMLVHEKAVHTSEDVESIHQMRVASRRLRASLQVLEGVYSHKLIQRYRRGLRRIAGSLGEVRDGDVFLEHITTYRDSLPNERRAALEPLINAVTTKRVQARQRLLKVLKRKEYITFKKTFFAFLKTSGKGEVPSPEPGITQRVRDFAGSAIWRRYELWRAYETVMQGASDETLHQARIAGKHLRYTIELFADSLGPDVKQVLDPLLALQDCLGVLQDGETARGNIAALGLAGDPGALDYLSARNAERVEWQAKLPWLWEQVASAAYQRQLFTLIVGM
jgi:CHAD domain-containing protein